MVDVRQTSEFREWFESLRDENAKRRVAARIVRVASGLIGDVKPVGGGVSKLRVDYGPGYRLYFVMRGKTLVILLCGGDKSTQDRDVKAAKGMAEEL